MNYLFPRSKKCDNKNKFNVIIQNKYPNHSEEFSSDNHESDIEIIKNDDIKSDKELLKNLTAKNNFEDEESDGDCIDDDNSVLKCKNIKTLAL